MQRIVSINIQSATIIIRFIDIAKINMVIINISVITVTIKLHLIVQFLNRSKITLVTMVIIKQLLLNAIMIFTLILDAMLKSVIIHYSLLNQILFYLHLCLNLLEKLTLNVYVVLV